MFKKLISFLVRKAGYTEKSLARAIGKSQSTVNRMKRGQEPRHSDGEKLKALYEKARKKQP